MAFNLEILAKECIYQLMLYFVAYANLKVIFCHL